MSQPTNFNPNAITESKNLNHGAVAIEQSRAVTEAQGKLVLARQFPRDEDVIYQKLMQSCKRMGLASVACYSYPKGGQTVSGPSIRLAEEIARLYGNIEYGIRELSNVNGESEMESYAWDLQTNVLSTQKFKVKHEIDAYGSVKKLKSSRDIYEVTANMGARRLRSRMLAILPPDMVELAVQECKKTLGGNNEIPIEDRVREMLGAFKNIGVNKDDIEKYLDCKSSDITSNQIADLLGIFNSINNGQSGKNDWFKKKEKKLTAEKAFNPAKTVDKKPIAKKEEEPKLQPTDEEIKDKF